MAGRRGVSLEEERDDGLSPELLVIVTVGLEVASVLLQRPVGHLNEPNESEEVREGDLGHDRKAHPRQHLKGVVGTRDVVKEEARGDWALAARGAKVP
jgi:hypothetical protein